ncbi:hypothetical protein R69658_08248 [Paraburkholderia aspalathi]|uniref:Uncharacterized protein n=1 Tax=Paraburkholderia aspalathi TaxID=1324617 RepID=A0ABM8T9M5_9BURK|nr:hypothetical protein R69658_08248 [Paraburkholderia aspalathi]CAE6873656.1 hypothetical protein R75465_08454 [Paraburkholderia aspalathi]
MAFAVAASVFEAHVLQHGRLRLDVQLFAELFAHAMQGVRAAWADLLVFGQVVFDALAWQVRGQRLTSAFAGRRCRHVRQACVGQRERGVDLGVVVASFGVGDLFSLVKDAIPELLAGWSEAFALRQAKLLFQLGNAFAQVPVS